MQEDDFDFIFGETPAEAAQVAAEAVSAPAAVETPKVETPAPTPAPAAPVAAADPEFKDAPAGFVPLAALHEARGKIKTLQEAVEASKKAPENPANRSPSAAAQPPAPVVIPEVGTPEYARYVQDQLFVQSIDNKFLNSETRFIALNGVDKAKELQAWVDQQDEHFFRRLLTSSDPYTVAYKAFETERAANEYRNINADELTEFRAYQAAKQAGNLQPAPVVVPPSQVAAQAKKADLPTVASSGTILEAPSAGGGKDGNSTASPTDAFDSVFN